MGLRLRFRVGSKRCTVEDEGPGCVSKGSELGSTTTFVGLIDAIEFSESESSKGGTVGLESRFLPSLSTAFAIDVLDLS
jgi:hypothetical protein